MLYKEDWEFSKKRFEALWERELIDRPCISVTAPKKKAQPYPPGRTVETYEDMVQSWTDPKWILERYINGMERSYYGGDALPMIFLNFGAGGHAAYFGCPYTFKEGTVWFEEIIHDWDNDPLVFDPRNELYIKSKEAAVFLANEGKGKFFVSMPDSASASDALAHIRGSQNLLADFITEPERVKSALKLVTKVWLDTNDEFFTITQPCNDGGSCIGWLNTWAPGRHAQLQCDLSVMISSETFNEFIMPELEEACAVMDHPLYHFDGIEQIRHLDSLLSIGKLGMIQWTSVAGQPPAVQFIPELKKIQAAGKGLLLNVEARYVKTLLSELSPKGLYIVTHAESEEDARALVKLAESAANGAGPKK
jgi:hypothetical protein